MPISFRVYSDSKSLIRPSNTTAYAAGDVISAVSTNDHFTFKMARANAEQSCTIERASITSTADATTKPDIELWLFSSDIAEVADNSAFAVTNAEINTCIGVIDFPTSDWKSGNSNSICHAENLVMVFKTTDEQGKIFGQLVVRNAYTPESAEAFQVTLHFQQD